MSFMTKKEAALQKKIGKYLLVEHPRSCHGDPSTVIPVHTWRSPVAI